MKIRKEQDMAQANPGTELLNIKEAAAFLKVSEASLRRWTNAGKLACMRLGAKRERRFGSFGETRLGQGEVGHHGLPAGRTESS